MKTLLYLLVAVLMVSCTVQKRKYTNGWYISKHQKISKSHSTSEVYHFEENESEKELATKLNPSENNELTQTVSDSLKTEIEAEIVKTKEEDKKLKNDSTEIAETTILPVLKTKKSGGINSNLKIEEKLEKAKKSSEKIKNKLAKKFQNRNKNGMQAIGVLGVILIVIGVIIAFLFISMLIILGQLFDELLSIF